MKLRLAIVAVLMALASSQSNSAENPSSGNSLYEGCKVASNEKIASKISIHAGMCIGTVTTIIYHQNRFNICSPKDASFSQVFKILVKYMDDNPQLLHEDLAKLAVTAFRNHWAC